MAPRRRTRWYDSEGQRNVRRAASVETNPTRRLISLVMLLALVLIMIQQVSDPKRVSQVGQAIGLFGPNAALSQSEGPRPEKIEPARNDSMKQVVDRFESLQLHAENEGESREQAAWEYLFKKADQSDLYFLATLSFSETSDQLSDRVTAIVESFREVVNQWKERIQEESNSIPSVDREAIEKLDESLSSVDMDSVKSLLAANKPLRLALDRVLLSKFGDGKIWMSHEQIPALRTWQRTRFFTDTLTANSIQPDDIPQISVAQLVSTGNSSYRGIPLRFRGTIAGTDQRAGKLNVVGWPSVAYRVWWMKPTEMSNQPVAVYVPVELEPATYEGQKDQELEIIGFFCKKVAYAAEKGAEVAPVLFAAKVQRPSPSTRSSSSFAHWLQSHRGIKAWLPPQDFATPRRLLVQAVEAAQRNLGEVVSPVKDGPTDLALVLLLEAARLAPELQLLGNAGREWQVGEGIGVGQIRGQVTHVKAWPLRDLKSLRNKSLALEAYQRAERNECYELQVEIPGGASGLAAVKVITNQIPKSWNDHLSKGSNTIRQPIVVNGITVDAQSEQDASLMIADQVAWMLPSLENPTTTAWEPPLSKVEDYLLGRGWNLSHRDIAQELQSPAKPIDPLEMEGLYSLMELVSRTTDKNLAFKPSSIVQLVKSSQAKNVKDRAKTTLEWLECDAKVVRVTRIPVESPLHQAKLGGDHYYQLDCMADIGNVTFEIQTDQEPITYAGEYPVTCLATNLPDWMLAYQSQDRLDKENAANEDVFFPHANVQVRGWFYRFWSYRTQEMSQSIGSQHRQVTPLVVVQEVTLPRPKPSPTGSSFSGLQWLIGLGGAAGIWWFLRRQLNQNNKPKRMRM
jgi:gas vesicle protein